MGSKIDIISVNISRHYALHAQSLHTFTQSIQCYTTSCIKEEKLNGRYSFTSFQRRNLFLLPIILSHILIFTSLFHRTSLGASATFPPNRYCERSHVCVASNYYWRGWKSTKDLQKYWKYWCYYANIWKIDHFLSNISCPIERDAIITAFAARVRSGVYSKNSTIKVQWFTDALTSISNTIQLSGNPSPLYRA